MEMELMERNEQDNYNEMCAYCKHFVTWPSGRTTCSRHGGQRAFFNIPCTDFEKAEEFKEEEIIKDAPVDFDAFERMMKI